MCSRSIEAADASSGDLGRTTEPASQGCRSVTPQPPQEGPTAQMGYVSRNVVLIHMRGCDLKPAWLCTSNHKVLQYLV